jgi:glycosyltransferase involved in cell wall biosynthesis
MEKNQSVAARHADPLVSVILVTRNRAEYLERAMLAIFAGVKEYPNTEVIVIDGGSTDGTVELLRQYHSRLAYWHSEPDSSVGEAVNKGLARARGEFIHIAADDDQLFPSALRVMSAYLVDQPEVDSVWGEAEFFQQDARGNLRELDWPAARAGRWRLKDMIAQDEWGFPSGIWPAHQLTRRRAFVRFGGFDTWFKYFGYIDLYCRQTRGGAVFEHIPEVVVRRIFTPKSGIFNQPAETVDRELTRVLWKYGGVASIAGFWYRRKLKRLPTVVWTKLTNAAREMNRRYRALKLAWRPSPAEHEQLDPGRRV